MCIHYIVQSCMVQANLWHACFADSTLDSRGAPVYILLSRVLLLLLFAYLQTWLRLTVASQHDNKYGSYFSTYTALHFSENSSYPTNTC